MAAASASAAGVPAPPPPPAPPSAFPPPTATPAWHLPARVGIGAVVGTVVLGLGNPNTTHIPLCPLQAVTGIDCPACGSLRAVHSLARADVVAALDHNALFTVLAPVLVFGWVVWLARSLGRPLLGDRTWPAATKPLLLAAAIVFAVARNLAPFAYLGSGA